MFLDTFFLHWFRDIHERTLLLVNRITFFDKKFFLHCFRDTLAKKSHLNPIFSKVWVNYVLVGNLQKSKRINFAIQK